MLLARQRHEEFELVDHAGTGWLGSPLPIGDRRLDRNFQSSDYNQGIVQARR